MKLGEDNKIAEIFSRHYSVEDALEIERCIKGLVLDKQEERSYQETLISVLTKNDWSAEDAQSFAEALTEM